MDLHANAVLTVRQRQRVCDLVATGVTITAAALVVGCSRQTASKWVNRRRRGEGVRDRSSRPHHSPRRTPAGVEESILRTRAELREGPHVIGWALGLAASTVHAVLRRHGRSRLIERAAREEVVRYERSSPGELVHVDIKKLGRITRPGGAARPRPIRPARERRVQYGFRAQNDSDHEAPSQGLGENCRRGSDPVSACGRVPLREPHCAVADRIGLVTTIPRSQSSPMT